MWKELTEYQLFFNEDKQCLTDISGLNVFFSSIFQFSFSVFFLVKISTFMFASLVEARGTSFNLEIYKLESF